MLATSSATTTNGRTTHHTTNGRTTHHTTNALNQTSHRTLPPYRDFRGEAHPDATVSVDGTKAQLGPSGTFHHPLPLNTENFQLETSPSATDTWFLWHDWQVAR